MSTDDQSSRKLDRKLRKAINAATPCRVTSRELLGDRIELVIEHEGREYRLRLTQNGKLILTA
ncbi:MAG: hemin uptake protein HemP [Burkholderiales bacterium]|nr:hemin uptake protein HemP [Burkholderiales bacterium]